MPRPETRPTPTRRARQTPTLLLQSVLVAAASLMASAGAQAQTASSDARATAPATSATAATIAALSATQLGLSLDRQLFDAYNRCDLARFGALFAEDVEFFHDQSGLMRTREAVVEATRRYICGKSRRELIEGSLRTYEMKGYGLVQLGEHRFCPLEPGASCSAAARFVNLWKGRADTPGSWQLTRVISYDH